MKKILVLSLFVCLLCGCTAVQDMSLEQILELGTNKTVSVYNKYRKGYKYNAPKGIDVINNTDYNETLASKDYNYYLYVDAVSYFNKIIENYVVKEDSYVSMPIAYEDKYGYLEINELKSGKYFIEIMYNYAKIEVIVRKVDINVTVANSISILASVEFNDNVLKTLLDEETSQFKELDFNIFETKSTDSEYMQAINDSIYVEEDEGVHDSDLID